MDRIMILKGDCIEMMKAMKPNSVDAVVCDPPYGLEFMGKEWDKLESDKFKQRWAEKERKLFSGYGIKDKNFKELPQFKPSYILNLKCQKCGKWKRDKNPCICKEPIWKAPKNPKGQVHYSHEMQLWHTQWLTEAYQVLKPGGSMLVMGGTRTSHRLACAIEDSGFIIKDTLMWLYGSGFPKAQDLGKMIDKRSGAERKVIGKRNGTYADIRRDEKTGRDGLHGGIATQRERIESLITAPSTDLAKHWDGFKVGGIKPAYEPIIWAVKPPEGSYVDNVLKWGVGAVNVDECRISHDGQDGVYGSSNKSCKPTFCDSETVHDFKSEKHTKGRFPANVILDEEAGRMLDEQSGNIKSGGGKKGVRGGIFGNQQDNPDRLNSLYQDNGGASRFFYCAKASKGERNAGLEGMEDKDKTEHRFGRYRCKNCGKLQLDYNPCKCKNPELERIEINKNVHPTVKPIKLFEYLIKLVTREGQVVLDPFIGSGTTAIAAHNVGRKCVGIEKEDEYLTIAKRRITYWENQPKQNSLNLGE